MLALCLTIGCKAQTVVPGAFDAATQNRRVEVMVRARFSLTPDIDVAIGARQPSNVTGYDTLPVTLSRDGHSQSVNFLVSTDGKTLARLETFDLVKDPIFTLDLAGRAVRGNPAAKVTVVSFDDLECPYCARMHQALFPATINRYKDKVRFIYKDFPLLDIHPWAVHAAVDANCIATQSGEAYWNYVDYVHGHGDEVSGQDRDDKHSFSVLDRIARQEAAIGKLDSAKLDACLTAQDDTQVKASLKEAMALGLDGAPALFINGERINGALPENYVWMAIDRALRSVGEQPPPPADSAAKAAPKQGQ